MNKHQYRFSGKLTRVPFVGKPSAALARIMPVENENDFAVFTDLPCSDSPILLNFIEHYQILNDLVTQANVLWPQNLAILVRISMPGGMRLPKALLADNVLLMEDVRPEVARLKDSDANLLVIEDNFIRYQLEKGDNSLSVDLFSSCEEQRDTFQQFIQPLSDWGVQTL